MDLPTAEKNRPLTRHNSASSNIHISTRPFAGRLGGNQQFAITPSDPSYPVITHHSPDAAPNITWAASFDLHGFFEVELWKEAVLEGWGSAMLVYLSGLAGMGLVPMAAETSLGPVLPGLLGGLTNLVLIPLFIYAGAPVSGGHFNSFITISTFCARLATFPRTVLYVLWQCLGATIGGFMVRASLAKPQSELVIIPGCYVNTSLVTPAQAYAIETMSAMILIFIAFGVGLDPRQAGVFGPALSPILIGFALALLTFTTSFTLPGFSGASNNPSRCLGLMAASGSFHYHYIHWAADITAAIVNGMFYAAIPPYVCDTARHSAGQSRTL